MTQSSLIHFDTAKKELAMANSIDEVKDIRDKAEALRAYAKQAGESLEMQNMIAEIKIRAERKAGELLKEQIPHEGGRPEKQSNDTTVFEIEQSKTLKEIGISRDQSSTWQKIANIPEEKFEKHIAETKDSKQELTTASTVRLADEMKGKPHVSNNSGNNEWYTPSEYIKSARKVLGSIDLDPASSELANTVVKATKYYTIEDDGLIQDWHGKVYMNPPYATDLISPFIDKLIEFYEREQVNEAIVLVNNATETKWFQSLASIAISVCFPTGRVKYWCADGQRGGPLQGQAILYVGDNPIGFEHEFKQYGWVLHDVSKLFPENV